MVATEAVVIMILTLLHPAVNTAAEMEARITPKVILLHSTEVAEAVAVSISIPTVQMETLPLGTEPDIRA